MSIDVNQIFANASASFPVGSLTNDCQSQRPSHQPNNPKTNADQAARSTPHHSEVIALTSSQTIWVPPLSANPAPPSAFSICSALNAFLFSLLSLRFLALFLFLSSSSTCC